MAGPEREGARGTSAREAASTSAITAAARRDRARPGVQVGARLGVERGRQLVLVEDVDATARQREHVDDEITPGEQVDVQDVWSDILK